MALQVRSQLLGGAVATLGVLAHRHADDAVDLAAQEFLQPRRRGRSARDDVGQQLGRLARGARDHLARRRRFLLADDALHLQQARTEQLEWPPSAQQLVEQHAEHVDVAGGRDHVATHLLRARVRGRHDAVLGMRDRERRRRLACVEQLRDAEIQQLRHALRRDQDVVRLQVAMHDQVLVRVVDGRAHRAHQRDPLFGRQSPAVAVGVDRFAVDVLHDEVRRAVRRAPAIEQSRDVRVLQRRQDLPLHAQPALHLAREHAAADQLDRDLLLVFLVGALGEIHVAHAAGAELAQDPISAEPLAFERAGGIVRAALAGGDLVPEADLRTAFAEPEQHVRQQRLVRAARETHVFRALARTEGERALDDRRDFVRGGVHGRQSCISRTPACNNESDPGTNGGDSWQ